ncbi:hypothetical protein SCHIN_v1c08180 [Spiroplasma chinense]|uniref:Uncharacterized protein n=1 Tax=Spiroplasma chinense TaxID=216932 RepID=A0A5B9Y5E2_9MOLU|nr:hypothetical protein [Spiroplasma chinense]QEH62013.1 hypothetical protein SCHIN_v1c08180 [Spiroplasma chinense]
MSKQSDLYVVELPIIRRNFSATNSAKFKGVLKIISNKFGIIKDWKITFHELWLDLSTTPSWFDGKKDIFKIREKLFEELNLKQIPRKNQNHNEIRHLNSNEIEIVNEFLNNRNKYRSTIKNILTVLKGSNPSGEVKNPWSAEMILDYSGNIKNFAVLIGDLISKRPNYFDLYEINAKKISLEEFTNLNEVIKKLFIFMQESKDSGQFKIYMEQVKDYYKKYCDYEKEAEKIARNERNKYSTNIIRYYTGQNIPCPFGFSWNDNWNYQKCHIYEYYMLRDKIEECLYTNNVNECNKYLAMISDPENFIPLPEELHRKFDKHTFTYVNGVLKVVNDEGKRIKELGLLNNYLVIQRPFFSDKKNYYFEMRNKTTNVF